MPCVPRSVRLAVPGSLALRSAACSLPVSHACVGQKPSSTYATRTLLAHSASSITAVRRTRPPIFRRQPRGLPAAATPAAARSESRPRSTERSEGVAPSRARAALTPRPSEGFLLPPVHTRRPRRLPRGHWVISAKQARVTPRERRRAVDDRRRRPSSSASSPSAAPSFNGAVDDRRRRRSRRGACQRV